MKKFYLTLCVAMIMKSSVFSFAAIDQEKAAKTIIHFSRAVSALKAIKLEKEQAIQNLDAKAFILKEALDEEAANHYLGIEKELISLTETALRLKEELCKWEALKRNFLLRIFRGKRPTIYIAADQLNIFGRTLEQDHADLLLPATDPLYHDRKVGIPIEKSPLPREKVPFFFPICIHTCPTLKNMTWHGCLTVSEVHRENPFIVYRKNSDGILTPHTFFRGIWTGLWDSDAKQHEFPQNIKSFSPQSIAQAVLEDLAGRSNPEDILSKHEMSDPNFWAFFHWSKVIVLEELGKFFSNGQVQPSITGKPFLPIVFAELGLSPQ